MSVIVVVYNISMDKALHMLRERWDNSGVLLSHGGTMEVTTAAVYAVCI